MVYLSGSDETKGCYHRQSISGNVIIIDKPKILKITKKIQVSKYVPVTPSAPIALGTSG